MRRRGAGATAPRNIDLCTVVRLFDQSQFFALVLIESTINPVVLLQSLKSQYEQLRVVLVAERRKRNGRELPRLEPMHLRSSTLTKLPRETRRVSHGPVDGVAVRMRRVDAIDASSSSFLTLTQHRRRIDGHGLLRRDIRAIFQIVVLALLLGLEPQARQPARSISVKSVRTASKIEKETSHDILSWRRCASMARRRRNTSKRGDRTFLNSSYKPSCRRSRRA